MRSSEFCKKKPNSHSKYSCSVYELQLFYFLFCQICFLCRVLIIISSIICLRSWSPFSTMTMGSRATASQLDKKFPSNLPSLMYWISCFPPVIAVFVFPVYFSKSLFSAFASLWPGEFEASAISRRGFPSLWSFSCPFNYGGIAPSVL